MIIKKIKLENFKSHKNTEINLNNGINLILGKNGSGKSTILESISFALFKEADGGIDNLIRKPADDTEVIRQMLVTLEFEHRGQRYIIERGKKGRSNIANLYSIKNDKRYILSSGTTNITKDVEDILEIDSKSFKNAVYIKQGEITDLIDKTPSAKKEFITKLLNIDSLEVAWEETKELKKEYEERYNFNQGQLKDEDEIKEKYEKLKHILLENNSKIEENEKLKKQVDVKVENLLEKIDTIENIRKEYETMEKEIEKNKKNITEFKELNNENIKELETIKDNENVIKQLEKTVEKLPKLKELKELKRELEEKNNNLTNVNHTLKEIEDTERNILENTSAYEEYNRLTKKGDELHSQKETLQKTDNDNKIILNKKNDATAKKEELHRKIQNTSQRAYDIFNKAFYSPEDVEKAVLSEKKKLETYIEDLEKHINTNNSEITRYKTSIQSVEKSLKDLKNTKDTCPICQSEISHEKHDELHKRYKNEIIEYETRKEELESANKNQEKILKEKKSFLLQIEEINIPLLKEQNEEFNKLRAEIKGYEDKDGEIKEIKTKLEEVKEEIKKNQEQLDLLKEKHDLYEFSVKTKENQKPIDEIKTEKVEIEENVKILKDQCIALVQQVGVRDNIDHQIKYLEDKQSELHQLKGKAESKERLIESKEKLEKSINDLITENKKKEEKIEALNYNQEEYETAEEEFSKLNKKSEEINKTIIELKTNVAINKENKEDLSKKLEEIEEIHKNQDDLKDYLKLIEKIRKVYSKDGAQKTIRDTVRPEIERNTYEIFSEFDFDYSSISIDENYDITIRKQNTDLSIKLLSGGERIVIALALRLGIARVITNNKIEILILDEPTIHLDSERREKLIDIIRQINIVPQMLVVSHDEEMESLSNNIIKISKTEGISTYTP